MEALKVKSGNRLQGILETGKTTARTDSVFSSTKMETNMKECGREIGDTAKVHTGEMRQEN
jgi:hypothetical protein